MSRQTPRLILLSLVLLCPAVSAQQATMSYRMDPVGVRTDRANIAAFNSPIFTYRDAIYLAFVRPDPTDGEGYQTVVGKFSAGDWEFSVVEPRSRNDPWHAQPSLAVDRDGHVHVTYNMHSSLWQYSVSKKPENISGWEFRGQELRGPHDDPRSSYVPGPGTADIPGSRITYQFMTTDRNGVPYIIYREALKTTPGTGYFRMQWSLGLSRYDPRTKKWRRVGPDGGVFPFATQPGFRAQGGHLYFDLSNRMHVSWTFYTEYERDGSGHLKPSYPCYAYSEDGGQTFHKADGTLLSLPVDLAHADVVLDPSWCEPNTKGYFTGYTQVSAMPDGTPYVQVFPKDPPPGKGPAIIGYDPRKGWRDPVRTPYSGRRFLIDRKGVITAISSGLRVHRSRDGGQTWQTWEIDTDQGPYHYWPDYSYTPGTNQLRFLAQTMATGELRVYTVNFSDIRPPP